MSGLDDLDAGRNFYVTQSQWDKYEAWVEELNKTKPEPYAGRYREFFQFGMEIINPRDLAQSKAELIKLAKWMVALKTEKYEVSESVKRGLSYYVEDGFEISVPELGAQKQVCGGGAYKQGIGFAIGFDRLMLSGSDL